MAVLYGRCAAAGVVASMSLLLVPQAWGSDVSGVAVVAHRGASGFAPENTLSSVAQGLADRADFVELDVRLTKDGVPVLMHDATLARTTDVEKVFPGRSPWRVEDLTLTEVLKLDAGSWMAASYANERVPTLSAVLGQLSKSPNGAILEVKDPSSYGGVNGIGAKVYETLRTHWPDAFAPGPRRLLVSSADPGFVQDFAAQHPEIDVSVISKTQPPDGVTSYADDVEVRYDQASADLATEMHGAGLTLGGWTVDDRATMRTLSNHLDSITPNQPRLLRSTLEADARLYSGTSWPARETQSPSWRLSTSGRYLNRRVGVKGVLTTAAGSPARWQRAAVQRWTDGSWRTLLRRATDASGRFATSIPGRRGLRIRIVSLDDWHYPIVSTPARDVVLRKVGTSIRLSGPRSARRGDGATLEVRWRTNDDRAVDGRARLFRYSAGAWRYLRDVKVSSGHAATRVRPRRSTRYQIRGRAGWWYTGAVDDKTLDVRR